MGIFFLWLGIPWYLHSGAYLNKISNVHSRHMGRIWEIINASHQHMLTHVPNGQIASSPLCHQIHTFVLLCTYLQTNHWTRAPSWLINNNHHHIYPHSGLSNSSHRSDVLAAIYTNGTGCVSWLFEPSWDLSSTALRSEIRKRWNLIRTRGEIGLELGLSI